MGQTTEEKGDSIFNNRKWLESKILVLDSL